MRIDKSLEAIERQAVLRVPRVGELRLDPAAFAAWLLPTLLIVYLALNNGGYDEIERGQVGVAIWWIVLVGTVIGVLPVAGGTRWGRAAFGLLAAFAGWTALSLIWTESAERTATEVARVATYLGVFALALAVQGKGRWRPLLHGVTTGVVIVCAIAVLSRLEPTWFSHQNTENFLPGIEISRRLAYPLNYSSGLGAFAAIGLPLLLAATSSARTLVAQALAAAALPLVALTLWLTTSSLSVPAAAIALIAFFILAPDRLPKLATLALAAAGSAILFAAEDQRGALDHGLRTATAQHQGHEMLVIVLVVCAGVALVQTAIGLAARYGPRPAWTQASRRQVTVASVIALVAIVAVGVAAGVPGQVSDKWDSFKSRGGPAPTAEARSAQILDFQSSGRYQFWQAAVDANKTDPLIGIGPGTFDFWWAEHGSYAGYTRDAHSLYLETLAELGIVGLLLIGGFSFAVLAIGTVRCLRAPPDVRLGIAAATAGCAAFVAVAVVDWVWELAVLPVVFLVLAAIAVAGGADARQADARASQSILRRYGGRIAMAVLALAALVAISLPLAGATALQRSRDAVDAGRLDAALSDAEQAAAVQPYAAAPDIQRALILELSGRLGPAADAAREATREESANWRNWLTLSRLEARNGDAKASLAAYRKARSLNPLSGLFAQ
ncbi:MAG: O-antigen ligase family protein [Chloroflexota bacterium]|nr:O-antigen ligase family protein [Chloroflexota bacterium]